jgi:hypothetical protein
MILISDERKGEGAMSRVPGRTIVVLLLLSLSRVAAAQCGGEDRWPVKAAADTGATQVDVGHALPTLLKDLVLLIRPQVPSDEVTRLPEERVVRVVDGRLVKFTLESGKTGDQDYHLVVSDDTLQFSPGGSGTQPSAHSFIAEILNPGCIAGRKGTDPTPSHFQAQLAAVRDKFNQRFPNITGGWNPANGIAVHITGVEFFDRPHGQTGRALNGLEIHPVLDIEFDDTPAPISPATTPSPLLNAGFEAGAQDWTASASVISNDAAEPAHSGSWKAWLGGYGTPHTDTLSQQLVIPGSAQTVSLNFYLHISTAEQQLQQFDTLEVQIRSASGQLLKTLKTYSNLQATPGFSLQTFDLSPYKGSTIRVELVAREDNGSMTSFVVDDFSLVIH